MGEIDCAASDERIVLRDALLRLIRDVRYCSHDDTHRGGAIWTICDQCGQRWADDEGGFKPNPLDEIVDGARNALDYKSDGIDCKVFEKRLAKCAASRVVYCGDSSSSVVLELRAISNLVRDSGMSNDEIADYCNERANELELKVK